MYRNRRWLFTALSLTTAGVLIVAPAAWADDDKKSDDHGGRAATTQVTSRDRGEDHGEHAGPPAVKVEHQDEAVEHQNEEAVEHQHEAVEHANEAAEKAAEQANEAAEKANEAAEKAAERAAEAAREAAEEAAEEANEPAAAPVPTFAGASLLAHLQNEAAELTALSAMTRAEDVDEDNDEAGEVEDVDVEDEAVENVQVVNLSALTAGLSAADVTALTNAATADAPLVSSFFAAGSPAATALQRQLAGLGVTNLGSVLAILHAREHGVLVILNA